MPTHSTPDDGGTLAITSAVPELSPDQRALASAAGALPRLRARGAELDAEAEALRARMREDQRRVQAIVQERQSLLQQIAAAERADARLRELAPAELRQAQLAAQKARDAQVGGDAALVTELEGAVASAEEALSAAGMAYDLARSRLDAAHEDVRRRLGVTT